MFSVCTLIDSLNVVRLVRGSWGGTLGCWLVTVKGPGTVPRLVTVVLVLVLICVHTLLEYQNLPMQRKLPIFSSRSR